MVNDIVAGKQRQRNVMNEHKLESMNRTKKEHNVTIRESVF